MSTDQFKILIVDDSDFSRITINEMLSSEPYQIIGEASNAKEALTILKERRADLAIIDIVMPETSGIELASILSDHYPDTGIIMISSLAQENIVLDAISAGASDYLKKPFSKEDFIASIEKVLSQQQEI